METHGITFCEADAVRWESAAAAAPVQPASHQLLITSAENGKRLIRAKWINSNVPHALINFHCARSRRCMPEYLTMPTGICSNLRK
jgi:hypothetical protein